MTAPLLTAAHLDLLRRVDTPTICNAIEVVQGRRGFAAFTRATMHWSDPSALSIVGYARTAKIAGAVPPKEDKDVLRARRQDYFRHMAKGGRPGLAVVEDVDGAAALGAWWGEVHSYVHKNVCDLAGAVTNGLMRDLADLSPGFPILAGGLGPSHGFVHVREIGTPVTIHGLTVHDGDLVHADCHGALVIPADVLEGLPAAMAKLHASEEIVIAPLKAGPVTITEFEALWAAFEKVRT
jgi:regulator of RNase E activity RraA